MTSQTRQRFDPPTRRAMTAAGGRRPADKLTGQGRTSPVDRVLAALILAVWCAIFGALHLYWALGGRLGLGGTSAEADTAFAQPWFAAYNAAVILLSVAGMAVAVAARTGHLKSRPSLVALLVVTGGVLVLRGAVGWASLLAAMATRGSWESPFLLLAVEVWFLAGASSASGSVTA